MPFDFKEVLDFMETYGFYDVVLPFLLVFTIIFATLQKIKIFGKEGKKYNMLIALSISLLFVAATNLVEVLNEYLPVVGLVLALFLGMMLLLGIFGVKEGSGTQKIGWILGGGISLAIGISYLPKLSGIGEFFEPLEEYISVIVVVTLIVGLIVWMVAGSEKGKKSSTSE